MTRLIAIDLPGGPELVVAVARAWDAGHAVFPLDPRLPDAARTSLLAAVRPTHIRGADGITEVGGGVPAEPGDALVIASSGTSGPPRAVVLTLEAMLAAASMTSEALDVGDGDRWLLCLPAAHIGGFGVVARSILLGTPITAHPGFDAGEVQTAAREGATLVSLVPTTLRRIDPSLFRTILLGGSAIPANRPANAVASYGLTETAGGVVYDGHPLPGVEVRTDDGGQIHLKSPTMLRVYRDGTDPREADGFLATGDLGRFDAGRLVVEGRRDDVIITGGHKVWPERVEAVLIQIEGVARVRVMGRPDPEWGEVVVAQVVASGEAPSLDEVRAQVKDTLPAYMAPREMEIVADLPVTPSGKLLRR